MNEYEEGTNELAGTVTAATVLPTATPGEGYPQLTPALKPLPLLAVFPERSKQRRWTVLLRAFLAIPLAVVTFVVGVVAAVCVVLGWFFALVMGRVPEFVRAIVTVFLRMLARLEAYLLLLTDRFPPFSTGEVPEYGVCLAVPPATGMNRAAVLFRVILVIPASILLRLAWLGMYVVSFFMWFVVLITGWLPKPIHEICRAYIRYEMRVVGYFGLLIPTYPGELFGDLEPAPAVVQGHDGVWEFAPEPGPAGPQQPWLLVLGMGARRLFVGVIVLGVAAVVGLQVLNVSLGNHENLVQLNNQMVSEIKSFSATANNCQTLSCLEQADGQLSAQLGSFASSIEGSSHAGVSQDTFDQMVSTAQDAQRVLSSLANAGPSQSGYHSLVERLQVQQVLTALGSAQQNFANAINAAPLG